MVMVVAMVIMAMMVVIIVVILTHPLPNLTHSVHHVSLTQPTPTSSSPQHQARMAVQEEQQQLVKEVLHAAGTHPLTHPYSSPQLTPPTHSTSHPSPPQGTEIMYYESEDDFRLFKQNPKRRIPLW